MTFTALDIPGRALGVGAHPDDVEFGCGATLAKWAAAGCEVHILVLTDGSKGSWDDAQDRDDLVAARQDEQRAAAAALGAIGVHFLGLVDGELQSGFAERARVCEVIRDIRPDVVLGHDPWKRYRIHPDHRYAGFLTLDAIVAARDPHFYPGQRSAPHRPDRILLFEAEEVDHAEAIEGFLEAKVAALLCHRSQWRSTMRIHDDPEREIAEFETLIRERAVRAGMEVGLAAAEVFKQIDQV
ncbi:MAG: PIG-L family deacetylase [Acidimicrobiia bacterium]|nr:PIG-L family deacetylase [Acidimicrobiia bacterium]